jgi:hypothetical protein
MSKDKNPEIQRDFLISKLSSCFSYSDISRSVFGHYVVATLPKASQQDFDIMQNNLSELKGKNKAIGVEISKSISTLRDLHNAHPGLSDSTESILGKHIHHLGDHDL